ncbi:MAG: hypothetical protein IKS69_01790 [Erysipelotrichaceae bacterium]|nr:hypothetical protein [Erysipelotrichaceae bacterium]
MSGLFKSREKGTTIADLQKVEMNYDHLLSVSANVMGGMEDTHQVRCLKLEDGIPVYVEEITSDRSLPIRVCRYSVESETIWEEVNELIRKYNLPAWEDLPFDEEFIALDAPSTYINLAYDNSAVGGPKYESYTIDYDDVIPEGGYDILNQLRNILSTCKSEERMIETYLMLRNDGKETRIYTGKEIDNTDEEIKELLKGYWKNEDAYLYLYWIEEGFHFGDDDYVLKGFVHEPIMDADASWYAVFEHEGEELYLTVVQDRLLLIEGDQTIEMKRY